MFTWTFLRAYVYVCGNEKSVIIVERERGTEEAGGGILIRVSWNQPGENS